ncbi:MAG: sulfite exporter TauE/SafE family protein [Lachnospiraceae bacterium]|nr:sulfite exporter TauE/SafE family protein [Lachnospiraceae bacterium]
MIQINMIVAIIIAFMVKGLCGFANTLVFTSILSFKESNINISPVEVLVGYPSNLIIAWKERRNLDWKIWLPLSILVILGCLPGVFFLKIGNVETLKVVFGFVVVLIGIEMFFREYQKVKKKSSPIVMGIIGLLSGLLSGLFGIGALLAAYVGRTTQDNSAFKGNLCVVFVVENTFRIILYSLTGIITLATVKSAVVLLPFMLFGLLAGMGLAKNMNEKYLKKVIIVMLILSGLSLIASNLSVL